jgi:serine/threonine protein phosphatase 1
MALIAIGDIHGCVRTLEVLLEQLAPTREDQLIFIGDYVDRGPDARGVIERLLRLREELSCVFLRGNHEALMLQYLDRGEVDLWFANGGLTTLNSYRGNGMCIPETHEQFLRETLLYYDTQAFFFVHGGLKPDLTIAENLKRYAHTELFLWEREHLNALRLVWEKTVVCGHTPVAEPINRERLIAIDTGCVYTHPGLGRLTAVRLPERSFLSIPRQDLV